MDMRELYEEIILDHNRNPRNFRRKPEGANRSAHGHNPLCGDELVLHLRVSDGIIEDVTFEGEGCAISTASASLMTEALKGKSAAEAKQLFDTVHRLLTESGDMDEAADELGKLAVLGGVREFPMRVKCASLPWHTLQAALENESEPVTTE